MDTNNSNRGTEKYIDREDNDNSDNDNTTNEDSDTTSGRVHVRVRLSCVNSIAKLRYR
jgi:hypothetical protein